MLKNDADESDYFLSHKSSELNELIRSWRMIFVQKYEMQRQRIRHLERENSKLRNKLNETYRAISDIKGDLE